MRKQLSIQEWLGFPLAEEKHCPMPATARPTHTHSHACGPAGTKPKRYNPRHPERTLLHQTIAEHFETWHALASAGQFDGQGVHPHDCGHDYFGAYSCTGRCVCPSCNPSALRRRRRSSRITSFPSLRGGLAAPAPVSGTRATVGG